MVLIENLSLYYLELVTLKFKKDQKYILLKCNHPIAILFKIENKNNKPTDLICNGEILSLY